MKIFSITLHISTSCKTYTTNQTTVHILQHRPKIDYIGSMEDD